MNHSRGFTLVELLIYASLFAFISVALTSIFITFLKTDIQETASVEVSSQANFILQRLQNYISNAGFLVVRDDDGSGTPADDETDAELAKPHNYLIIKDRAESTNNDVDLNSPIVIYRDTTDNNLKVKQGKPSGQATITTLNTDKVLINKLTFTKVRNPGGRDVVLIDLGMEYRNPAIAQKVIRNYTLGVGKAFAAVFDTTLTPSTTDALNLGTTNYRWQSLFLERDLDVRTGPIKLGSNSDTFTFLKQGSFTVTTPMINAEATANITNDISGLASTDRVFVNPPNDLESTIVLKGAVAETTPTSRIKITLFNTSSTQNFAGGVSGKTWYYFIIR